MLDNLPVENGFPVSGLLPKKETQVTSFLAKYPEYDGRGTVIAIFDSGVDPGAPGLQTTTDGKVKVIHRFDCSGSGDVNTSTIVEPTDGYITGITGRKLKIPSSWKNPTNTYRVGVKNAYVLYTERLRQRVSNDYKENRWDSVHRIAVAEATRAVVEFDAKHTGSTLSDIDKLQKENLDAKLEGLVNFEKKFADNGPVYDCILWHDGDKWQCCIDTTEIGDLEKCVVLGEYSKTHQYGTLTALDNLNYSINVHDNGNVLEVVGLCSSHGTHVASIAAAHFPDKPELNGVAPGAQIISCTIGDGRLGSMETGTALVRAIIKIMELTKENKVHVINMSYGEHTHVSDSGRIGELMNEIVNRYGVIWVASAGNAGPALSTIGTPPDISQETIIGVGAYVSPEMMVAAYSMREKLPGMAFTWSSRGPCIDGGIGVTVCAPGGAVTSVPNCTLRYSQLMNGTSMASPHVAGALSVVISGLLKENISYSPYSIKRAIENTAFKIDDVEVFAQGSGLLQVEKCFNHLSEYRDIQEINVRFQIGCGSNSTKGIYVRNKDLTPTSYNITVEPYFLDSDNVPNDVKINFNIKLALICNASYVSYPSHLDLSNGPRVFAVRIDPIGLPLGVHNTFIEAFDVTNVKKGAVFRIPITIIQPQTVVSPKYGVNFSSVLFHPNTIKRHFFVVPNFATWANVKITTQDENSVGRFVLHTMHILPRQSCKTLELNKVLTVASNTDSTTVFQVRSNSILEVVVAKYWANIGDMVIDYSVTFYGVKPNQQSITMLAADGIQMVEVTSLQGEEILPTITLKNSVQILKPHEHKLSPLTSRDIIPPNRQIYELILSYNFTLTKATEISPNFTFLSDVLYESEFESQFWILYSSNKQVMGCGDAYPSKYTIKLEKGEYVIKVQIRHEKKDYLEKLSEVPMTLQQKLSNNINLDVYSSYSQAIIAGKKPSVVYGLHSMVVPYYIAPLPADKFVPKSNNAAQFLTGTITYCKDENGKKVDIYPVKYVLCDNITKKSSNGANNNNSNNNNLTSSDKNKYDEAKDSIRDFKVQLLGKLDNATAEKLYEDFIAEYPNHMAVHVTYLQNIDPLDTKHAFPPVKSLKTYPFTSDFQNKVISICNLILENINEESVLAHMAVKTDLRPEAAKIKTTMEQQKNMLIEALCRKGIAFSRLCLLDESNNEYKEEITKIWKSFCKFVDPNDAKATSSYIIFFILWHARVFKHYGRLLKYTCKLQEEKLLKDLEEKIVEICQVNEWKAIASHIERNIPSKFPSSYALF